MRLLQTIWRCVIYMAPHAKCRSPGSCSCSAIPHPCTRSWMTHLYSVLSTCHAPLHLLGKRMLQPPRNTSIDKDCSRGVTFRWGIRTNWHAGSCACFLLRIAAMVKHHHCCWCLGVVCKAPRTPWCRRAGFGCRRTAICRNCPCSVCTFAYFCGRLERWRGRPSVCVQIQCW